MDVLPTLASIVGKVAPLLGSVLGSPLSGMVMALIASAFGAKTANAQELLALINGDPNASNKLKELELQHQVALAHIEATNFQVAFQDRQDARLSASRGNYEWFVHLLATLVTAGFFTCILLAFYTHGNGEDHAILNIMLGGLATTWVQVISFYFGNINKN